jgi:hypothetical protein
MPLLDHFHPPLSQRRHWEALHTRWASAIADQLNTGALPEPFFAEPQVHLGGQVQVDVATLQEATSEAAANGTATSVRTWAAPPATWTMPASFPDSFEVQVISAESGPRLVAAIELVSPGNKDRPESRRAFAAKCAGYLSQGIGVMVVDVVTSRLANLHNELLDLMRQPSHRLPAERALYGTAYRPVRRDQQDVIDIWAATLALGEPLPTLPLFPAADLSVPVDLETAYAEACEKLRLEG